MDVNEIKDILRKEYGIDSFNQLVEAMKNSEGLDISIFVTSIDDFRQKGECYEAS